MAVKLERQPDGSVLVAVKVVPGASRDRIVGPLGESLKVAVAQPPEGGRANRAVCRLIAAALGCPPRDVTVRSGAGSPFKTIRVAGVGADRVRMRLGLVQ